MSDRKPYIAVGSAEEMADQILWRRLATDSAYQNATDANAQSSRESQISDEVWAWIEEKYEVGDT